jgi:cell division protease FtsH
MPVLPELPKKPSDSPPKPDDSPRPPIWRFPWWYIVLILVILWVWVWQEVLTLGPVKTITYSEFKSYLARDEVQDCKIQDTEITGHVALKSTTPEKTGPEKSGRTAEKTAVPPARQHAESAAPKDNRQSSSNAADTDEAQTPGHFAFRTDYGGPQSDPDLVKELQAHKVNYSFARPSVLSQFLFAWLLPLGVMILIWLVLSRGLRNAGQAVMGFGRSKARMVADKDTGVTFEDVAGCDEA